MILEKPSKKVMQAIFQVKGFEQVYYIIEQQIILDDKSKSTLYNYSYRIAEICLYFNKLPERISMKEINRYLSELAVKPTSLSRSTFKHMVYGLRFYYKAIGRRQLLISLPRIKEEKKLHIILNKSELKDLFNSANTVKHKVLLLLIYSAGLRGREVINLHITDIDFERKSIHIRQSKYKKDRIVPLADMLVSILQNYISTQKPNIWLFNGSSKSVPYSKGGIAWIMLTALKRSSVTKKVSLHSLRHSYATHLLEQGVNIASIKDLLGHESIITTMVYLQIAQCEHVQIHSPLDRLYND